MGKISAQYDGVCPQRDLLDAWNPNHRLISEGEYYGWSYIPNGVDGSWKEGINIDVKTAINFI